MKHFSGDSNSNDVEMMAPSSLNGNTTSSTLRHRNVPHSLDDKNPPSRTNKLKRFDLYSKIHDDYAVQKTRSGGTLSLFVYSCMFLLVCGETWNYLTPTYRDHIVVDTTMGEKLPIGLNITFPSLRCDEVSVDTVDSSGDNQINIASGNLKKLPVNANLDIVEAFKAKEGQCLSCFEAQPHIDELLRKRREEIGTKLLNFVFFFFLKYLKQLDDPQLPPNSPNLLPTRLLLKKAKTL